MEAAVLSVLEETGQPVTAYEIQERAGIQGVQLYPTQIYRTLRRLCADDRARRIESLNAFVRTEAACDAILICDQCKHVVPVAAKATAEDITRRIVEMGFDVSNLVIEAHGRCSRCRGAAEE